jgi:glutamine amidotransferase
LIAIVDYKVGNTQSVLFALGRLRQEAVLSSEESVLRVAEGIILPGVGAFPAAMDNLRSRGLHEVLRHLARTGTPLLGICLGHQLLFAESEEQGFHAGLGLFTGRVRRFPLGVRVPHMGWNQVMQRRPSPLLEGIQDSAFFYFAHSYYVEQVEDDVVLGVTDYAGCFPSVVGGERVFGVQFHPEKSGPAGLRMLASFCHLCGQ